MKKIFTLLMLLCPLMMMATEYQDSLTVTVNGISSRQIANISIEKQDDGLYTLSLKNFKLISDDTTMPIGNVTLKDMTGHQIDGYTFFKTKQDINIEKGDTDEQWTGPLLGPVPVDLAAFITADDRLRTVLHIEMTLLNQIILVEFGSGYQLENGGFEKFHDSKGGGISEANGSVEPDAWHSFNSAKGDWASMAGDHCYLSNEVREGATGTQSVLLKSTSIALFGIVANGTITTGRLNAGSMSASNPDNHSESDMNSKAQDCQGKPFYTILTAQPDELSVWVKFTQKKANSKYPYATVNAVLNDGTYYQDPEDKTYTNVVAKATNREIATNDGAWQQLKVPFDYDSYASNGASAKSLLVTFSTNAEPGQGSGGDELYIDDVELVYNHDLTALKVKNQEVTVAAEMKMELNEEVKAEDIVATTNGKGAIVVKEMETSGSVTNVTITVYGNDLVNSSVYKLEITNTASGVNAIKQTDNNEDVYYNMNGVRIEKPIQKGIYIKNNKKVVVQ